MTISINEELSGIATALRQRKLSQAIDGLDMFGVKYPERGIESKLCGIRDNYRLMTDYWRRGLKDDQMSVVYDGLLRRAYCLFADVALDDAMSKSHFASSARDKARRLVGEDVSGGELRGKLEEFVSNVAMLSLEPAHTRMAHQTELYEWRQRYMNGVFDYIWTSGQWSDGMCEMLTEIVIAPTVDTVDQQLVVSAVTIGAMNMFDVNKLRMLANAYHRATDERVRQRALVGLALALNDDGCGLFPEVKTMMSELVTDPTARKELTELQIQLLYCLNAENDNETIQRNIMPDLLKRSNMHITPHGLEEGEDALRDILDPEAAEKDMEQVEASFRRMADMQKDGVDVYFGGFSQMKRFPFFDTMSNWFVPFYKEHPAVSTVYSGTAYKNLLRGVLDRMPFCDSDKYSFVMAFQMVVGRIPQNIRDMLNGEVMASASASADPNAESSAYIRRSYLQGIYRFFRLFPSREFFDGLSHRASAKDIPAYLFFANPLFRGTKLELGVNEVASFLLKRKCFADAALVLANYEDSDLGYHYYMLCGNLLSHFGVQEIIPTAKECFEKALEQRPNDAKALVGYARACFKDGDYDTASTAYAKLVSVEPGNRKYALGYCVCLTNTEKYDEALALLYKMDYEQAGDGDVNRVMARALMGKGNCQQAQKIYESLGEGSNHEVEDLVNHGYCEWFLGNVSAAAQLFSSYLKNRYPQSGATELASHCLDDIMTPERDFILKHGVSDVEIHLMVDEICSVALQ